MATPKQVQQMGEQADKIQADLNGTAQPATPEQGTVQDVTPTKPLQTPPEQTSKPAQPDLEQKYQSLLGRVKDHAEELKTARANNDLLYNQISDLNREKAELQVKLDDALAQTTKPDDKDPDTGPNLLDVEKISQYGAEFGDMAKALNQVLQTQKAPDPASAQPTAPAPQHDKTIFRSSVTVDVYNIHKLDYNDIDVAPEFSGWLKEFSQATGVQNMQAWAEAITVRDKATCLSIINNFLATPQGQAFKTRVTAPATQQPAAPNQQPDVPLGTGVDPTTVTTQPVGKIYTGAEILEFFTEVAKPNGRYKENPDEAKRIEADIFKAQTEGRVQG